MTTTTRPSRPCAVEGLQPGGSRRGRGAARRWSGPRRVALLAATSITVLLLSGCSWALHNGVDAPVGRRTCSYQDANMVHVDTAGFSSSQNADIRAAIEWLRGRTGVPLHHVASPGENWWEEETGHILIERARVVDGRGFTRTAYSKPYDRNRDGWYDAGVMWIDPSADSLPTWGRWGPGGSNFFKLIVHELGHQLGIADVGDPTELMGSTAVAEPGWGDGLAYNAVGC
jgi:hypothetical protein